MTKKLIQIELIWWLITAIIVGMVMYPVLKDYPTFPFKWANIIYIVLFVTFTRYTFLLKHTFLANRQRLKAAFLLLGIIITASLIAKIQDFQVLITDRDPEQILASVSADRREPLLNYLKSEFIFFAVGCVIATLFLAGRLGYSIWRLRNRGKV